MTIPFLRQQPFPLPRLVKERMVLLLFQLNGQQIEFLIHKVNALYWCPCMELVYLFQNQADSYKYQKKKGNSLRYATYSFLLASSVGEDFTFGVEGGWVLAPTRHGAHNWEGTVS